MNVVRTMVDASISFALAAKPLAIWIQHEIGKTP